MARGVNKVILIGNLGNDPDTRYTANGGAVTNLSLATTDSWRDKQTGENQERTEWHRVVLFGKLGEIAGEYLRKGSKVFIEGRLQTRKWQGKDGQDRYTTEIVANDLQMLDSKGGSAPYDAEPSRQSSAPAQKPAPQPAAQPAGGADYPPDDFGDDIPF